MWVEKYRPQKLEDVAGQTDALGSISSLLKKPADMPHLMFSGSAGVGKTTTALCIARQLLGGHAPDNLLELNASDERGINMVREKVKRFSNFAAFDDIPFKIIILDEADEMTSDAQTALRRIIEDASRICRFILIANNVSRIIEPIQSRCAVFKFRALSDEDVITSLRRIARAEKVKADAKALKAVCDYAGGDMRNAINILQAASGQGAVTEGDVRAAAGLSRASDVDAVVRLALGGRLAEAREKMLELTKVYGMSESDFLRYASGAAYKEARDGSLLPEVLQIMAKYDYRILAGANPEIQLSAMLAELGAAGKEAAAAAAAAGGAQ